MFNELKQPYFEEFEGGSGGDSFDVESFDNETDSFDSVDTAETEPTETIEAIETPSIPEVAEVQAPKTFKVKFNHEEMDIPEEEASTWIQKGLAFDKSVERARQEARDSYIAEQGYTWNGKAIINEAEYKNAMLEQEVYNKYQNAGLPEEVINELIESKRDREERKAEKQAQQERIQEMERKQQIEKDAVDFFDWFQKENGRGFEVGKDEMPDEVWQAHLEGKSLVAEYSRHENKLIKQKLKILEQNTGNLKKAPVSGVASHGADKPPSDVIFNGFDD